MRDFLFKKRIHLILASLVLVLGGAFLFLFRDHIFLDENARFEKFTDKLFCQEISSNTLNLHYTLAYPEEYGIEKYEISLGTMDPEELKKSGEVLETLQDKLEGFSPAELSVENQMLYDILRLEFATQRSLGDLYLLQEPLGPNLGIQAQLPVLLAEYPFRVSADIKDYFSLLAVLPDYFQEILEFEKKKSQEGLFMSDTSVDRILEQCLSFAENKEENYLYDMFNQRVEELLNSKRITRRQADSFIETHDKLMKQFVFPAYLSLAEGLENLKGTGKNENGLSHFPRGKAYYEYLVKSAVGDFRPIKDIQRELSQQLISLCDEIQELAQKDPDLFTKMAAIPKSSSYSPEEMLDYLRHVITDDFPVFDTENYEVKYVPEAMEEFSSPAFYLTPPIDTLSPNCIYINQSSQVSCAELFTTLAHEGFPGHLYQTLYFSSRQRSPVRQLFSFSGYTEGWATYVEALSYEYGSSFLEIEPDVMRCLCLNRSVSLCLYSLLDIGIHYQGWTQKTVSEALSVFGITESQVCQEIFQYIIENPGNYLKYYLGFLNFRALEKTVREIEGTDFRLEEFHKNLLDLGPAQFPVVKKYLLLKY